MINKYKTFLSKINLTEISSNLVVVSEEIPSAETFALGYYYECGSRDESPEENGIAHFIEHCAFRRTKRYSSRKIASLFESVGAYANAYTTQESTSFYVRALKENFLPTFKLLNDITRNTIFDFRDIEKEKQIILEEIKSYDDDPEEYIFDCGDRLIFGDHPMGSSILGNEKSLNNFTDITLSNFHNKYYRQGKLFICCAGPFSHSYLVKKALIYIDDYNLGYIAPNRSIPEIINPSELELDKSQSQSHLLLGSRIPGYSFESRFHLPIFNILFGDGMSSRLYQNLRDKFGIAYSIYSTLQVHSDCGVFYIYAACDKAKLKRTEKLIFEETDKFLNSPLKDSELNRAKIQLKSSMVIEMESLSARMQLLSKSLLMKTDFEDIRQNAEMIDSITSLDIKEAIAKYIGNDKFSKVRLISKNED